MTNILHLETSGPYCSVAVAGDGKRLSLVEHAAINAHAKEITRIINTALYEAGLTMSDIHAVAVSEGPGSYTGLRVSASAAKGICYARNIPLIAISTLQSLADEAYALYEDETALYIPMIDARRMEVYTGIYTSDGKAIVAPHAKIIETDGYDDIISDNSKVRVYCGSGVEKCKDILDNPRDMIFVDLRCRADHLIRIAFEKYQVGEFVDFAYFKPFYLKSPNITTPKPML